MKKILTILLTCLLFFAFSCGQNIVLPSDNPADTEVEGGNKTPIVDDDSNIKFEESEESKTPDGDEEKEGEETKKPDGEEEEIVTPPVIIKHPLVKIHCLGDSITEGYISPKADGYRKYLYNFLSKSELFESVDMVGSKKAENSSLKYIDNGEGFEYDGDHDGYSAHAVKSYSSRPHQSNGRNGLYEKLFPSSTVNHIANQAGDAILLQIGTNDMIDNKIDGAQERFDDLVKKILESKKESSVLFVTSIPCMYNHTSTVSWFKGYGDGTASWSATNSTFMTIKNTISAYNTSVQNVVKKYEAEGKKIKFVDLGSTLDEIDFIDGVHPTEAGYKSMGKFWAEQIIDYYGSLVE